MFKIFMELRLRDSLDLFILGLMTSKMFILDWCLDAEMEMQNYNKLWCNGYWESILFIPKSLYYYIIERDLWLLFIVFRT